MADDFPSEYDAIILGTGLPESVIAAALARVGKSVLHLDRNDYYSSEWATFTFDGLLEWIKANEEQESDSSVDTSSGDDTNIVLPKRPVTVQNVVTKSYLRTKRKEIETKEEDVEKKQACTKSETEQDPESPSQDQEYEKSEVKDKEKLDVQEETPAVSKDDTQQNKADDTNTTGTGNPVSESNTSEQVKSGQHDNNETGQEMPTVVPMMAARKVPKSKPPINKDMTYQDLEHYFRQFNIDIAPKMLFSRGPLVEAIISANISHYAEFKAVNRILTYMKGNIEDVPCSRSDVFSSKMISAIEKRTLMKFLTFCIDFENHEDEYKEYEDKSFIEFLQSRRLSPNLQHFVLHSISMLPPDTKTITGLKTTRSFLQSLGRYGNTPFIWPLYGVGELPQAFCRMCAVFGGLYCLRRSAESITLDASSNTCIGITSEGQFLKCNWLIMGSSYLPNKWRKDTPQHVSRAVFITDKCLKASDHGAVTLMSMPRTNEKGSPITVIELDKTSSACPSGLYVVHLVTDCCVSAEEDLKATAEELLYFPQSDDERESSKPVVLWSLYFNHAASYDVEALPSNMYCTVLPGSSLGFSQAMNQAKKIFQSICGDEEEFLPAIPNPEDIIMDDIPAQGYHAGLVGGLASDDDAGDPLSDNLDEEQDGGIASANNDDVSSNPLSDNPAEEQGVQNQDGGIASANSDDVSSNPLPDNPAEEQEVQDQDGEIASANSGDVSSHPLPDNPAEEQEGAVDQDGGSASGSLDVPGDPPSSTVNPPNDEGKATSFVSGADSGHGNSPNSNKLSEDTENITANTEEST